MCQLENYSSYDLGQIYTLKDAKMKDEWPYCKNNRSVLPNNLQ